MMPMKMMPNRSLFNIPSKEIHNSDASLIDGTFDSAVVGPQSECIRSPSTNKTSYRGLVGLSELVFIYPTRISEEKKYFPKITFVKLKIKNGEFQNLMNNQFQFNNK